MEEQLKGCIQSSLSLGLYDNAKFLAERLVAASSSEETKLLLATCYRHCNQGYRAVHLLRGSNSQRCRYLAALCCTDLRRYAEAEVLLLRGGETEVPNGAAGWYLLGRIARLNNHPDRAAECYARALHKDPMLWVAFAELCMLGKSCWHKQLWRTSSHQPCTAALPQTESGGAAVHMQGLLDDIPLHIMDSRLTSIKQQACVVFGSSPSSLHSICHLLCIKYMVCFLVHQADLTSQPSLRTLLRWQRCSGVSPSRIKNSSTQYNSRTSTSTTKVH
eukprot:GHUV01036499.1.p1 GENE.GHUV01036499.1~~GHUV01036499.1.p1  ORF type:complete len:275 (+),score=53.83 GHUV01036499.1:286-1110(+)